MISDKYDWYSLSRQQVVERCQRLEEISDGSIAGIVSWDEPCCLQENMLRNLEEMRWDPQLSCLDNEIRSQSITFCLPQASCIFDSGLEKSVQMFVALSFHIVRNDLFLLKL